MLGNHLRVWFTKLFQGHQIEWLNHVYGACTVGLRHCKILHHRVDRLGSAPARCHYFRVIRQLYHALRRRHACCSSLSLGPLVVQRVRCAQRTKTINVRCLLAVVNYHCGLLVAGLDLSQVSTVASSEGCAQVFEFHLDF